MALTQHFAILLGILKPRHDTMEKWEKHMLEQGARFGVKTTSETLALEIFLTHTAVASTGSDQDISFVSFYCFSLCCDGAACSNDKALQGTGLHFPREKLGRKKSVYKMCESIHRAILAHSKRNWEGVWWSSVQVHEVNQWYAVFWGWATGTFAVQLS